LDADDPLPSSASGPSTLITFENTFTTEVPMSGKAAPQAQARNPAINAYSKSSWPLVSWQILNFQISFLVAAMIGAPFLLAQFWQPGAKPQRAECTDFRRTEGLGEQA
jgi:hypothetical protein